MFTTETIRKVMERKGPIVNAVLLETNGNMKQIVYDCTPKLNKIQEIIKSPPTIIGEWTELQVMLVGGIYNDDDNTLVNKNKLRFPFNNESFKGDILLVKCYKYNNI